MTEDPGTVPHQRTLAATVSWSYDLCDPAEQAMWARASLFADQFDLESVEDVCVGPPIGRTEVVDVLDRLVGKSILAHQPAGHGAGYRLLETLRHYGLARLRDSGEAARFGRAHADRYLRLAEQAEREWFGPDEVGWFTRLHRSDADLRAALDHYLAADDTDSALRLVGALWFHWLFSGRTAEGALWLRRVLARPDGSDRARVIALSAAIYVTCIRAELDTAARLVDEARDLAGRLDDPAIAARVTNHVGAVSLLRGDPDTEAPLVEAIAGYEATGQSQSAPAALCRLAVATWQLIQGRLDVAAEQCEQVAATCRARGDHVMLANALGTLLYVEWRAGRPDRAVAHGREILRTWRVAPTTTEAVQTVEMLAWLAADGGEAERAAVLLGAADAGWRTSGWRNLMATAPYRTPHEECLARSRRELGEDRFAAAFRRGGETTFDEVVSLAIGDGGPPDPPAGPRAAGSTPPLTARQWEVAELVAQGLSNKEIAAKLVISQRTAESHIENMLAKLGYTTRAQIAAWVAGGSGAAGRP
jgi:non-specific serine/threonine protein kinase